MRSRKILHQDRVNENAPQGRLLRQPSVILLTGRSSTQLYKTQVEAIRGWPKSGRQGTQTASDSIRRGTNEVNVKGFPQATLAWCKRLLNVLLCALWGTLPEWTYYGQE